jgi:hypothetical protein
MNKSDYSGFSVASDLLIKIFDIFQGKAYIVSGHLVTVLIIQEA